MRCRRPASGSAAHSDSGDMPARSEPAQDRLRHVAGADRADALRASPSCVSLALRTAPCRRAARSRLPGPRPRSRRSCPSTARRACARCGARAIQLGRAARAGARTRVAPARRCRTRAGSPSARPAPGSRRRRRLRRARASGRRHAAALLRLAVDVHLQEDARPAAELAPPPCRAPAAARAGPRTGSRRTARPRAAPCCAAGRRSGATRGERRKRPARRGFSRPPPGRDSRRRRAARRPRASSTRSALCVFDTASSFTALGSRPTAARGALDARAQLGQARRRASLIAGSTPSAREPRARRPPSAARSRSSASRGSRRRSVRLRPAPRRRRPCRAARRVSA